MENSNSVSLASSEPRQYTTDSLSFSKQTTSQQHHIWASTSSSSFDTQSNYSTSSTDLSRTHQYFNNVSTTIFTFVTDLIIDNSTDNWTGVACDYYSTGGNTSNESCSDVANNSSSSTSNVDDVASVALVTFLTVVAATLAAFTAGTNLLVIVAFKTHKRLQTVSNYFLVSLSVADLTIGALSMPLFTLYLALGHWPLGDVICDIWLSIDYTVCNASVANLLLICLDRYLSISHPLSYRARRSGRLVVSMIIVAWIISFLLWTPWIVAWQFIEGQRTVPATECYIQFLTSNQYVTVGTAMLAFYLPVSVMCALYWRIYARTRRRHDEVSKLQAFKFKADSAASPAGEAGTGTATTTTSQPSTGPLANNNNNGTAGTCTTAVVSGDAGVESDLEQLTSKVKVRGLVRESSVVTFSPSVLSSCDRPPHTITALTLASCNEYTDVTRQFQNDVTDICKQTPTDASIALLQNCNDCINSAYVTHGNGFSIDSKNEVEFRRLKQFRRSAPDIWACESAADNSVRGSKSHEDLECDLNLDLGVREPALTTLMRWPSVAEMRLPASQQQAIAAAASRVNNSNKFCTATRQEIVPVSAQEYLYNVEMDDISNSGMTYTNTGDFDDSTSDNGMSSVGYRASHLRVNGIAGECTPTQTFCSVLATKFRGVRTRDGGTTSSSLQRAAPAALYTRRQKRRQAKAKESKAAKTLSAILVAFIVTWLPYNLFIIFEAFSPGLVPVTLYNAGYWLCYINSTVNPICYVLCNANFRRALKNLTPGLRHVPRAPPPRLFPVRRR